MLLLGIDIGTSSVKCVLLDAATGTLAASAGAEYPLHQPQPDYAEQNPEDWWQVTVHVVRQALSAVDGRPVVAIGLTGHMHGTTLLDDAHQPIHPSIIWADQRSGAEAAELTALFGAERLAALTGTLPAAGFMAATLRWLSRHKPDVLARARHAILPKDYVRLKLTGIVATDISDAAATGLFDVAAGGWAHTVIEALALPDYLFPEVLPSHAIAGELTVQAAHTLGLPAGLPVVAGCADQPAQAIANGVVRAGIASVTTGTGGQVCVPVPLHADMPLRTDPRLHVFNHAVPEMAYILGAILAAGLNLRWLRNVVGLSQHPDAYALLSSEAETVPPGAEGLLFMPYLVGERTPYMDPLARGGFIGLTYRHTRAHLARAVMEGVAFALRQTLELSLALSPTSAERIIATGGAVESAVWRQIQTDVLGLPLQRTALTEQTCVGAAVLAGIGASIYAGFDAGISAVARYADVTEPQADQMPRYDALYAQFCGLYPRLRDDFHQLAAQARLSP